MKNQEKMNQGLIWILGLIICATIFYVISKSQKESIDSNVEYMEQNGKYTIARIVEYSTLGNVNLGPLGSMYISYTIDGIKYETTYNSHDYPVPTENGAKVSGDYMAIYLPDKPEKCAVLYNYPVYDSSDYKRYINEFKITRPKLEREIKRR